MRSVPIRRLEPPKPPTPEASRVLQAAILAAATAHTKQGAEIAGACVVVAIQLCQRFGPAGVSPFELVRGILEGIEREWGK